MGFMNEWFYPLAISIGVVLIAFIAFLLAKLYIISDEFVVGVAKLYKVLEAETKAMQSAIPYLPDIPVPQHQEEEPTEVEEALEPASDPVTVAQPSKGVPRRNRPKPKKKVIPNPSGNGAKKTYKWTGRD